MLRPKRINFGPVPLTRNRSKVRSLRCNSVAASRWVNSDMTHLQFRLSEEANPNTVLWGPMDWGPLRVVCTTSPKSGQSWKALCPSLCAPTYDNRRRLRRNNIRQEPPLRIARAMISGPFTKQRLLAARLRSRYRVTSCAKPSAESGCANGSVPSATVPRSCLARARAVSGVQADP